MAETARIHSRGGLGKAVQEIKIPIALASNPEYKRPAGKPGAEPSLVAPLALRSDGKTLLSVAHLQGVDLTGRERWTAVVLTEDEAGRIRDRMMNAFDEAAGRVGGRLLWESKKDEDGWKGGDGE